MNILNLPSQINGSIRRPGYQEDYKIYSRKFGLDGAGWGLCVCGGGPVKIRGPTHLSGTRHSPGLLKMGFSRIRHSCVDHRYFQRSKSTVRGADWWGNPRIGTAFARSELPIRLDSENVGAPSRSGFY